MGADEQERSRPRPTRYAGLPPAAVITLAVCTRDRAELFERCILDDLRSLASKGYPVLVVDQSADDDTGRLVRSVDGVTHMRAEPGLSRARNAAVSAASTPLIAFTDDDVSLPPEWLEQIVGVFEAHPAAGAVCGRAVDTAGRLLPGGADAEVRWPANPFEVGSGFNVAFRMSALGGVGAFDEDLGAGARFRAAEDTDMLYRVLRAGWTVVCSSHITVVHHDWRTGAETVRLHFGYGMGAGAQSAKHVRARDRTAARLALGHVACHGSWLLRSMLRLRLDAAVAQVCYITGFTAGFLRRGLAP